MGCDMKVNHLKCMGTSLLAACVLSLGMPLWVQAASITDFSTLTQHEVEQSYYHDWNRNPKFRASVRQLFARSNVSMPAWVRHGAGPSAPCRVLPQGGVNWVLLNTCKMHDCGDNHVIILFNPPTGETYGLVQLNKKTIWLGKPNDVQKVLLKS